MRMEQQFELKEGFILIDSNRTRDKWCDDGIMWVINDIRSQRAL